MQKSQPHSRIWTRVAIICSTTQSATVADHSRAACFSFENWMMVHFFSPEQQLVARGPKRLFFFISMSLLHRTFSISERKFRCLLKNFHFDPIFNFRSRGIAEIFGERFSAEIFHPEKKHDWIEKVSQAEPKTRPKFKDYSNKFDIRRWSSCWHDHLLSVRSRVWFLLPPIPFQIIVLVIDTYHWKYIMSNSTLMYPWLNDTSQPNVENLKWVLIKAWQWV